MRTYVDTSAFMALLNADDRYHGSAAATWKGLIEEDGTLVCNNYVLVETFALLQHRFGLEAVRVFQDDILPVLTIRWIDETIHGRAVSALLVAERRRVSLVDWSVMETMRARGVRRIFTFDRHFAEYGFLTLPEITSNT